MGRDISYYQQMQQEQANSERFLHYGRNDNQVDSRTGRAERLPNLPPRGFV